MFEQKDFFEEQDDIQAGLTIGGRNIAAGQIGAWMLHLGKLLVIGYTAYHGIHASIAYGGDGLGVFFQAAGIVVTELTLLGLYLAFIGSYINGGVQRWIAFTVYALGLTTVILTSIADSFLSAGYALPPALVTYLQFGLPISPIVMLLGGFLVHYFEPTAVRGRQEAAQREELSNTKFTAWLASQNADLQARKLVANAMLNAKTNAASQIATQFKSREVQAAIQATALANLPSLLTAIGIDPAVLDTNKDGIISPKEVRDAAELLEPAAITLPEDEPTPAAPPASPAVQPDYAGITGTATRPILIGVYWGDVAISQTCYLRVYPSQKLIELVKISDHEAKRADGKLFACEHNDVVYIPANQNDLAEPHPNGATPTADFLA